MFCLLACMCSMCVPAESPGTGVTDACETTRGCWESNLTLQQKQHSLLIIELFLQPKHTCGFLNFYFTFILCVDVFPACMSLFAACVDLVPTKAKRGIRSSGIGVTGGWKPACRCWELNPGPLKEQPMLTTTETSFQLQELLKNWGKTVVKNKQKNKQTQNNNNNNSKISQTNKQQNWRENIKIAFKCEKDPIYSK